MNITAVWSGFITFLGQTATWLFSHGITIGDFTITFGALAIAVLVLNLILSVLIPWYEGGEKDDS